LKDDIFVSVAVVISPPLSDHESKLHGIQQYLDSSYTDYEIVIVGQGGTTTFSRKDESVLQSVPCLRYIQLTARVEEDVAWAAALENAIGDFVVMFDPEADPVHVIQDTVVKCKSGFDVVVGVAMQPGTKAYRIFRSVSKRILSLVDYSLPRDATHLRCLSRRAVNSVTRTGRFYHQLSMRIQKTGFPQAAYNYRLMPDFHRVSSHSLFAGVRSLLRLMVFNSLRPLRWMSGLGLLGSLCAFIFSLYSLLIHLVKSRVIEGWTTTILFMSTLFMIQFIMMAFFGEYIGRLLDEHSERADYSVVFEKNSSLMVNSSRINVFKDSMGSGKNYVQTGRDR
jgi:hypothetical protein